MIYEDIKVGDVVWLLPLDKIDKYGEFATWVDEMYHLAGTAVKVMHKSGYSFLAEGQEWAFEPEWIDYEKTSQVVNASQFKDSLVVSSDTVRSIKMEPESTLPEGVEVFEAKYTFTQELDGDDSGIIQTLGVEITDAGGGKYLVISTDRWAINNVEELTKLLEKVKNSFIALGVSFEI